MLKKIKEYIKNKNYEDRSLLLGIAKFLILTSTLLIILEMFGDMVSGGIFLGDIILKNLFLFCTSLISCLFFTINLEKKIDKYFLSFLRKKKL